MDVYVVKVGKDGNLQWQKTYGGKGNDVAYSITKTSDGLQLLVIQHHLVMVSRPI